MLYFLFAWKCCSVQQNNNKNLANFIHPPRGAALRARENIRRGLNDPAGNYGRNSNLPNYSELGRGAPRVKRGRFARMTFPQPSGRKATVTIEDEADTTPRDA